jgi:ubiquinone/menaquinone biosynthesis C-methylase UbiE
MKDRILKTSHLVWALILIVVSSLSVSCNGQQTHTVPTHRFDDIAVWVKVFEDPERDKWQKPDEVVTKMNLAHGDVVADIGAGTGYFTRRFAVAVGPEGRVLGLDIEQSMIEYMNEDAKKLNLKNYSARIVKTDDPELATRSVDVVFLCNTYHHIDDRVYYFQKVAGSLKSGGRLVIVDFYKKKLPYGPPPDHKLAKEVVVEELQRAGYSLKDERDFLPYQYYLEFVL